MHGMIVSIHGEKQFGFIRPDNGQKDIFFHAREVLDGIFEELALGEGVGYDALEGAKGAFAANIRRNGNSDEEVRAEQKNDSETAAAAQVRLGLKAFTDYLLKLIAKNAFALDHIEWRQLEISVAEIFAELGFKVELTESAKDGGKDVVVSYHDSGKLRKYFIEIKHWRSGKRVGERVVDDFVHVLAREKTDGGLLLATGGLSQGALERMLSIERVRIRSGEKNKILCLCRNYVRAKEGTWSPPHQLEDVVFEETLGRET